MCSNFTLKNPHWNMIKLQSLNIHCERKYCVELSGISLLFSKRIPWLVRVCSFSNLYITLPWYHQNGKLMISMMKQKIFETFASCLQINIARFLRHFSTPLSNWKNETKWQGEERCNGCHLYVGEVNVVTSR